MADVTPLIKWPGGKAREIKYIKHLIPPYERYIEPFFGGGAMFFYLRPQKAVINDISKDLTDLYTLIKEQDPDFKRYLDAYCVLFSGLLSACDRHYSDIASVYRQMKEAPEAIGGPFDLPEAIEGIVHELDRHAMEDIVLDVDAYKKQLYTNTLDKMRRTIKNEQKAPFSSEDLKENLITGLASGTYMYFRDIYNDILLGRDAGTDKGYASANFYFIREYCYGSMFRYNSKGEFNIPYGGMSYNRKDFRAKIDGIFSPSTAQLFAGADIYCMDFEDLFSSVRLTENDFMFLDPPYDTDFSDYEGRAFTQKDQQRLAEALKRTRARFILIIKNTDLIYSLYKEDLHILCFDKIYTYNVRSRNQRKAEHLIVTNMPI